MLRHPTFCDKILTSREKNYCLAGKDPAPSVAGRFAAKESVLKCLGTGLVKASWQDIEILPDALGQPQVSLSGPLAVRMQNMGLEAIRISISHSREYAVAVAVGEGEQK